jgi:hypothetical protein
LKYTFLLLLLLLLSLLLALRLRHCNDDMHRVPAPPRAKMANTTPKQKPELTSIVTSIVANVQKF